MVGWEWLLGMGSFVDLRHVLERTVVIPVSLEGVKSFEWIGWDDGALLSRDKVGVEQRVLSSEGGLRVVMGGLDCGDVY